MKKSPLFPLMGFLPLVMGFFYIRTAAFPLLGTLFLWLIGGQMIFLCLSAFLVDGLLKANFNEDGSPAKKQ